ncbi:MAG: hypothetical protein FH753_07985 [Firmicutes bacterium]|nr:hypothetical protein [Bacillota bacterium]
MCPLGKVTSCEIAFIPIKSENYIEDVKKVLSIIKSFDVDYEIGKLSTTITGNKDIIFTLIKDIYNIMNNECGFTIDIKISNICGCNIKD